MIDLTNIIPHEVSSSISGYAIGFYGDPGSGKAQPNSAAILTPNGWEKMGDLRVGDYVFNRLGQPVKVLGFYPQGEKKIYKLTFEDGRVAHSCLDHLWTYETDHGNFETTSLSELILKGTRNDTGHFRYKMPLSKPINLEAKNFTVDPYAIGVFLSDRSDALKQFKFSTEDFAIIKEVIGLLNKNEKETIESLVGKFSEKRIPKEYLLGSIEERFNLLQGLMDVAGIVSLNGEYAYYFSHSLKLAKDVQHLIRSLGFLSFISASNKTTEEEYVVSLWGLENIEKVFRLPQKRKKVVENSSILKNKNQRSTISLKSIEFSHREEATCIFVDDLEHLYVTEEYVVTHNTTTALKSPKPLLFALEKGYLTIPGTRAVNITSWTDALTAVAQLRKPEVRALYETIIIDPIDLLVDVAEDYLCQTNGVKTLSDIPWGGGHSQLGKMFKKFFREITNAGYGLIIIGHAAVKKDELNEEIKYRSLNFNKKVKGIIMGLLDQLIYVESSRDPREPSIMHFKGSAYWEAKSRFPNIVAEDILSYENLVKAIQNSVKDVATTSDWDRKDPAAIEGVSSTQREFEEIRQSAIDIASSKIESVGQSPVIEEINTTLMKKISETDISDVDMLKVLINRLKAL